MAQVPCTARRESDRERSLRLLKAIDEVGDETGMAGEWSDFERIVLHSVTGRPGREYPPPGHGCPLLYGAPSGWGRGCGGH